MTLVMGGISSVQRNLTLLIGGGWLFRKQENQQMIPNLLSFFWILAPSTAKLVS